MQSMATNENRNAPPIPIGQALKQIDAFIKTHLVCSMHHRTILALWVVHTYCYNHFPVTPYLEISSPEPQSGKSLCLCLLKELCHKSWIPGGVTAACLTTRLANEQPTLARASTLSCPCWLSPGPQERDGQTRPCSRFSGYSPPNRPPPPRLVCNCFLTSANSSPCRTTRPRSTPRVCSNTSTASKIAPGST